MSNEKDHMHHTYKGTYIIDSEYNIQYKDGVFEECCCGQNTKCYAAFRGNQEPCEDCPLHEFKQESESSIRRLLYLSEIEKWLDTTMISIPWKDGKECYLIAAKGISKNNRSLYLNYN